MSLGNLPWQIEVRRNGIAHSCLLLDACVYESKEPRGKTVVSEYSEECLRARFDDAKTACATH